MEEGTVAMDAVFLHRRHRVIKERAIVLRTACELCRLARQKVVEIRLDEIAKKVGISTEDKTGGSYIRNVKVVRDAAQSLGWKRNLVVTGNRTRYVALKKNGTATSGCYAKRLAPSVCPCLTDSDSGDM